MRLVLAWLMVSACLATGCGDDALDYQGEAGQAITTSFPGWVPLVAGGTTTSAEHELLVDSGAPMTILDHDSFPLGMDGKHRVELATFALTFPDYLVVSFDLFGGAPGSGIPDGIIGGDLLRHFALSLDYQGGRAWLSDGFDAAAGPAGSQDLVLEAPVELRVRVAGGGRALIPGSCPPEPFCGVVDLPPTRILAQARFEDGPPVWVMIDTGASATAVTEGFYASLGDAARPRLDGISLTTANGVVTASMSRVWGLTLTSSSGDGTGEGVAGFDLPILVLPTPELFQNLSDEVGEEIVALVGGSFLRLHLTTIDYPNDRVVLARYAQPSHIPSNEYVGVGFTMYSSGEDWVVGDVYPDTDAAAELLAPGDVIEELGGDAITGQPQAVVDALLQSYSLGQEVPVGVRRPGSVEPHLIAVEDLLPSYPPPP